MLKISDQVQENYYREFHRNKDLVQQDVEIIKTWMKSQPHLPEIMDDVHIRNFLTINKFSIEKVKQKIDMYYTIRGCIPDWYEKSNPKLPRLQETLDQVYVCVHPKPIDGIHRVHIFKPKVPNSLAFEDSIMLFFCLYEVRLCEDFMTQDIFMFDMANLGLNDMPKLSPTVVGKLLAIYEKVYSLRLKHLYYFNAPSYASAFISILRTFMKKKIADRIRVDSGNAVVTALFPEEDLPKDYGGKGPSLDSMNDLTKKLFVKYQDRFDVLDTLKVDESLRPEKLNNDEILGFYGNFKKLDVD